MTAEQTALKNYPDYTVEDVTDDFSPLEILGQNVINQYRRESFIAGAEWQAQQDGWISVQDNPPKESGRYWCNVVEHGELGKSEFQWNCAYNPEVKGFSDRCVIMNVTHWRYLMPQPPKQ